MTEAVLLPGALVTLVRSLIDYAGLFPPAALPLADAVCRYDGYRRSPDSWALGRFVVPVSRLEEFESAVTSLQHGAAAPTAGAPSSNRPVAVWPLSALAAVPLGEDIARVLAYNRRHAESSRPWLSRIDALEVKVAEPGEIAAASALAPTDIELFFEVPAGGPIPDLCAAAAAAGRGLKIRTGGTELDAFPPSAVVARFLAACAASRVPFKATAGLHHAVRSIHPVRDDGAEPRATMHGFLNVFVAAVLLLTGKADAALATSVLEDEIAASFSARDDELRWREYSLSREEIAAARTFARGFGSCSFEEPLRELAAFI